MTPTDASQPGRSERPGSEVDPTGMRALLSSLPDPGPMPEDLVHRIEARLAVEAHATAGTTSRTRPADHLVDLAAERSHRRPARTVAILGVAAAGLLVTTVALGQVVDGGIFGSRSAGDTAAQYPSGANGGEGADPGGGAPAATGESADAGSDEAGAAMARPDDGEAADAADAAEEMAGSVVGEDSLLGLPAEVQILGTLGTVTTADYRDSLERLALQDADVAQPPRLTMAEVAGCWAATGSAHRWDSLHAAGAELSDDPVVVLLGRSGDRGEAFLMPWTCTSAADQAPDDGPDPSPAPLDHVSWPGPADDR